LGHGETIVEIKKIKFFDKGRLFQISSQTTVLNVGKQWVWRFVKR